MKSKYLDRHDLVSLGGSSLLLIAFSSFFGRDLAAASVICAAVNVLLILGVAIAGV